MLLNILSQFKALKVRQQFLLLILLSATIPASVVGMLGSLSAGNTLSEKATQLVQRESMESIEELSAFLSSIDNDVAFLGQTPSIEGMLRARDNGGVDPTEGLSYEAWTGQLQLLFAAMLQEKEFHRLEYIDESGNVLVGAETDSHSHSHGDDDEAEGDGKGMKP